MLTLFIVSELIVVHQSERKYVVIDLTPSGILGIFLGLPTRRFLLFTTVFLLPSLRLARAGFFLQALGASFFLSYFG